MNSKVHPLVVALVMILTFVAIGLWMWGKGEASMIGGPAELRLGPNGHLYIQIQNRLIEHDADGKYVVTHDLSSLGVEQFLGSYDFFSDGDILLRLGPDPRSFFDTVRAFQRKTNTTSLQPKTSESGMFRCRLATYECTRFGAEGIDLKASHGIVIDWSGDDVYITDTSRHVLRKYSSDGTALSEPGVGFKFPNQVLIEGGQLYVADTNNHRIRVVDPSSGNFGKEMASHYVTPEVAVRDGQRWPSHVARVGNEWWVNNMRSGMNEGGIYIFDDNWNFDRKAALPPGADPIALIAFRDEVLVTDWNNDRVHCLAVSGELLGLFQSPGLEKVLEDSEAARASYQYLSYSGVLLLALVIGGLFVRALVVTVSPEESRNDDKASPASYASGEPLKLMPDPKNVKRIRFSIRIAAAMLFLGVTMAVLSLVEHEAGGAIAAKLVMPGGAMLAILVLVAWAIRANCGSMIGIQGDRLTLKDWTGRESTCSIREASYDETFVATRDMAVFLGRPPALLYDRDVVDEQLIPRLAMANRLSALQMQRLLIELRHPQGVIGVVAIVSLVAYVAWSYYTQIA